ncbi:phage head-tail connector protein [Limosilactobacillus fermentum]|uniref:phage head-tail connector protein n=1 Tax=Limosilactobacillus fermentum TaxID=1613 RepID=UPI002105E33B|nr:phage head-tail connector protein [Limosilactobacillus fermentum]MCQ2007120.1 phage head-tail connector protein [Limosilactobacillus fermentum]WLW45319.1 phage head-tail connector protein [Limosilactobacillus fermentum]
MTEENHVVDLNELKTMLQLTSDKHNALLNLIIKNTEQALRFKLGLAQKDEFPSELGFVSLEVCVRRYNRISNEGMASYSQEGQSITFSSSDFDDFESDINTWREQNGKNVKSLGRVQFFNPYRGDSRAVQS